jgi:hypothetical protein
MKFLILPIFLILAMPVFANSGGIKTIDGSYTVHTFTSDETFNTTGNLSVIVLVVAGGGGGAAGGGGAGGLIYNASYPVTNGQTINVVIGLGGVGTVNDVSNANNGSNSSFGTLIAIGGGGGARSAATGNSGGSGGGGGGSGGYPTSGGSGIEGQGYNGSGNGDFHSGYYPAGGGGGANRLGEVPANNTVGGNGGNGTAYTINGTSVYYAGGGGGGTDNGGTGGKGGPGGGADGSGTIAWGNNATNHTGGGGGGASNNGIRTGGNGGSGIVIVRYLTADENGTISTNNLNMTFDVFDEVTLHEVPYQLDLYLKGTNTTILGVTGQRRGLKCLYDNDESPCLGIGTGGGSPATINTSTVQAFDYSLGIFKLVWNVTATCSGTGTGILTITLENGTIIYSGTKTDGQADTTAYISIDNTNHNLPRAENISIGMTATCTGTMSTIIKEFRLLNNTMGYTYTGIVNNSISIPMSILTNYTTYDAWFRGEPVYQTGYSNQRMLRLPISAISNYNFNAYLLDNSAGLLQYFNVLDTNNQPIQDALLTFKRIYSGITRTNVQCASNPAGSCSAFIAPNVQHTMTIEASGFITKYSGNAMFTGSPNPANVYLQSTATANFTSIFGDLQFQLLPTNQYFPSATNASCKLISSSGSINWMNLTIYQINLTGNEYIFNNSFTNSSPTGTLLQLPLNSNGRYRIVCEYNWVSAGIVYQNKNEITVWIYSDALTDAGIGFFDVPTALVIALGITMIIAGMVYRIGGTGYGLASGICLFLIFMWVGWIDWKIGGLSILIAIALLVNKSWV